MQVKPYLLKIQYVFNNTFQQKRQNFDPAFFEVFMVGFTYAISKPVLFTKSTKGELSEL